MNFLSNGDDGFALVQGTEADFDILDVIGDWEGDPGSGWEVAGTSNGTQNHTLVRKSDVTSGVTIGAAAGTNADDFSGLFSTLTFGSTRWSRSMGNWEQLFPDAPTKTPRTTILRLQKTTVLPI